MKDSQSVDTQRAFIRVGDSITAAHWRVIQRTRLSHTHSHTGGLQNNKQQTKQMLHLFLSDGTYM